jgi:hypothetical protein
MSKNDKQLRDLWSGRTVIHRSEHDVHGDAELSTGVLMALDSLPGYDAESGGVVFDHVDLDALDNIFSPVNGEARSGHVTFVIEEYEVTATANGEITICELPSGSD